MLENVNLNQVLVLDIETVSQHKSFDELDVDWQELWSKKAANLGKDDMKANEIYDRAAIYAEFGKVICIGVGIFYKTDINWKIKVKSIHGHDEKEILKEFAELLETKFNKSSHLLAGHNGKEFDFPYLCRRMLINGIKLPEILNISGKKPWEIQHIDTMELWKFGDYKSFTSLNLLAKCFDIPSPKDDIDGSMVGHAYWQENNLERIANYCKKDVVTTAQVLLKMKGLDILKNEDIEIV